MDLLRFAARLVTIAVSLEAAAVFVWFALRLPHLTVATAPGWRAAFLATAALAALAFVAELVAGAPQKARAR